MIFTPTYDQLRIDVVQDLERRMQYAVGWWQMSELRDAPHRSAEHLVTELVDAMANVLYQQLFNITTSIQLEIDTKLGIGKPLEALSNEEIEQRCTALMKLLAEREAAEKRHG